ncbi:CIC11C00000002834 [Sungouiella intermedia]|uniref:CIC11C00000002834 n=1 Tax=Sungouiella intermedia TaxID=45354 RepID=A0A1L0FZ84_9ASCO|nr:CIC11C00000002834 [[Candida] intermedia]
MDFEEQLEKAERLESPSLVGSSLRSADDSAHKNYIHPEKYTGKKSKPGKHSVLNSSIGASLDDLISEGALLGSEEDFDRFLDDKGNVKNDAKYLAKSSSSERSSAAATTKNAAAVSSPLRISASRPDDSPGSAVFSPVDADFAANETDNSALADSAVPAGDSLYSTENYSAPNLSEYQLDHQIADHSALLDLVKSYDLKKLPSSNDRERSKTSELYAASERVPKGVKVTAAKKNPVFAVEKPDDARISNSDSLHTPYFPRDERSPSRSRAGRLPVDESRSRSTSRSRSVNKPHLARGDSYKSTHEDAPAKYELPANLAVEEEEEDSRRSRQSRPTMGDSIAAAEAQEVRDYHSENITRDPSLVTTGDYTNFNCDAPSQRMEDLSLFSVRSQSSTNYLRSISRSRSRQPQKRAPRDRSLLNEKNDANPEELAREGALVSDDPYDQMTGLDAMVDKVLKAPKDFSESSKKLVNDVSAEKKVTETKEQLIAEEAPTLTAADIQVNEEEADKATKSSEYVEKIIEAEMEEEIEETRDVVDVPAEIKVEEAHEQLVAEEAPLVTAKDIKLDEVRKSEFGKKVEKQVEKADDKEAEEEKEKEKDVDPPTSNRHNSKILDSLKALEATKVESDVSDAPKAVEETDDSVSSKAETNFLKLTEPESVSQATQVDEHMNEEKVDSASAKEIDSSSSVDAKSEDLEENVEGEIETKEVTDAETVKESEVKAEEFDAATSTIELEKSVEVTKGELDLTEEVASVADQDETLPLNIKSHANATSPAKADEKFEDEKTQVRSAETESGPTEVPEEVETHSKELEPRKESTNVREPESKESTGAEPATEIETETKEPESKSTEPEASVPKPEEEEDFEVSPEELRKHLESLPIYLFTSLAGGMQIIQKTNRLATILQGNGIKFEYRDLGTDEEAKKLWRRFAQGKTLPGVVRGDDFIGNWQYIDEVNEDYRLHEVLYETL